MRESGFGGSGILARLPILENPKLEVNTRTGAVAKALKEGLV